MRVLVATVFLTLALAACGSAHDAKAGSSGRGAAYLQQVREDLPSLDDVSDANLLAYGRYACKNPNTRTAWAFDGHGPTKDTEMQGMYDSAMRHCDALSK